MLRRVADSVAAAPPNAKRSRLVRAAHRYITKMSVAISPSRTTLGPIAADAVRFMRGMLRQPTEPILITVACSPGAES